MMIWSMWMKFYQIYYIEFVCFFFIQLNSEVKPLSIPFWVDVIL